MQFETQASVLYMFHTCDKMLSTIHFQKRNTLSGGTQALKHAFHFSLGDHVKNTNYRNPEKNEVACKPGIHTEKAL